MLYSIRFHFASRALTRALAAATAYNAVPAGEWSVLQQTVLNARAARCADRCIRIMGPR